MGKNENQEYFQLKPIELETITVNSQVASAFAISSSLDDKICILVEGGVFIYELRPLPLCDDQSITFLKFCIPVTVMEPLGRSSADKSAFLWNLSRKDAFEAVLDSTMYGLLERSDFSANTTQIIQCEFTPLIQNQSYVSCLTNTGLLEIFKKEFQKWTSCVNVTQLWIEHCGFASNKRYTNFNEFKTKALALKITAIKWNEKPEPLLVTSHKNGQICFWKVLPINKGITLNVSHCINVNVSPCSLYLFTFPNFKFSTLIIGSLSGTLKCVSISSDTLQIYQEFNIWADEDLIVPSFIKVIKNKHGLLVLTVKRHILMLSSLIVSLSGVNLIKTNWFPFPSAITSLNECHNTFIIGLQNHHIYSVAVSFDLQFNLLPIDVEIKPKYKTSYHCYGLTMSKNKAILMIVSSPKVAYDYLKGITDITIYKNEIKIFKCLYDNTYAGLIKKISKTFTNIKLNDISDFLELTRLELLCDEKKFNESSSYSENSTLLELKLMLWETKLRSICQNGLSDNKMSHLENLVMQKHASKLRQKLQEKIDALSEIEEKSLMALSYFLTNKKEREGLVCDNCIVCGSETIFESVRFSSCANGHKFPRCCISLLPCDRVPYVVCQNCDAVALTSFVSGNSGYCTLCDGVFCINTKFHFAP